MEFCVTIKIHYTNHYTNGPNLQAVQTSGSLRSRGKHAALHAGAQVASARDLRMAERNLQRNRHKRGCHNSERVTQLSVSVTHTPTQPIRNSYSCIWSGVGPCAPSTARSELPISLITETLHQCIHILGGAACQALDGNENDDQRACNGLAEPCIDALGRQQEQKHKLQERRHP